MEMQIQERSLTLGAVTLNYAETNTPGPPLVLLHGGSARWQEFDNIVPDLATHWHIFAPDFRGHGKSSWVPGTYRLQDFTDDTIAFLRHCLAEPAFIFGHSLGGIVALLVAAQYQAGVRGVIVGDAPLSRETWHKVLQDGRDRIVAWRSLAGGQIPYAELIEIVKDTPIEVQGQPARLRDVVGEDSSVFEWIAGNLSQDDPDTFSALIDRFPATADIYSMQAVLPAIEAPVLLLQADPNTGGLMTDAEIRQALPLLKRPKHVRLAQLSHVLHNERKEPVVEALTSFMLASSNR
jgi:pimeloyl-ACP methyl ester carboxylesterase